MGYIVNTVHCLPSFFMLLNFSKINQGVWDFNPTKLHFARGAGENGESSLSVWMGSQLPTDPFLFIFGSFSFSTCVFWVVVTKLSRYAFT